jgi:cyclopropane fatty-acyl-phospholipid synthase-like methyltransferase
MKQFYPVFEYVIFVTEYFPEVIATIIVLACAAPKGIRWLVVAAPFVWLFAAAAIVYYESHEFARLEGYDMNGPTVREALEDYINTGKGDMMHILEGKQYPPIFGKIEMNRYFRTFLMGTFFHNTEQDAEYLPEAYNKGDDWFEATLGEPMIYTGAIYTGPNETMWSAQLNKLEFLAHALGVKPGDKAMDIGAGWGRLSNHLASKGADVTGVLMASDQKAYADRMSEKLGQSKTVNILLKNFFDLDTPEKSFNVISSVEMAEHVGIRNYLPFLRKVHSLLADDGTFYLQVAGLPRGYGTGYNHYEDITWGMFMDEHVFPGADASCPMGWVVTKLEKAGFEVQNVYNLGYHYSRTLYHWQQTWEAKRDAIVKVYGERSFRRWRVFLAWSVRIARRGGSTVQFITATKSGNEKARIAAQNRLYPGKFQLPPHTERGPGGGPEAIDFFPTEKLDKSNMTPCEALSCTRATDALGA